MKLKKKYGFWQIFMMAISATIGTSVLVSFGSVGAQVAENPILMIVAWIIGGILVIPEMLMFSETAISYPGNGGAYYWIRKAKWNICSFWFGWVLVLFVSATAVASASLAFGNIVSVLLSLENVWFSKLFGIAILVFLLLIQIFVKRTSGLSQIFFTILKFLPIGLILIVAMIYGNSDSFKSNEVNENLGTVFMSTFMLVPATAMTMFAYSGMESIIYVSEEIYKPEKNIPKALILSTIAIIAIYVFLAVGLLTINEPDKWTGPNGSQGNNIWYWAIMNNENIPKAIANIFSGLTIFIFVGSLNSYLLYQSRLIFKMSEEKDLFKFFQKSYKKTDMPYAAILFLAAIASIYILWTDLLNITGYLTIALSILKVVTLVNIIWLRTKHTDYKKQYSNWFFWLLAIISGVSAALVFSGSIIAIYVISRDQGNMSQFWIYIWVIGIMLVGYPIGYLKVYFQKRINKKKELVEQKNISD